MTEAAIAVSDQVLSNPQSLPHIFLPIIGLGPSQTGLASLSREKPRGT